MRTVFLSKPETIANVPIGSRGLSDTLQRVNHILAENGFGRVSWSNAAECRKAANKLLDKDLHIKLMFSGRQDGDNDFIDVNIVLMNSDNGTEIGNETIGYLSGNFINSLETEQPIVKGKKMKEVAAKAKVVGTGMVDANKTAFAMAASMQSGRANNKVIKEAVRPLVKLMFKPSFMQRLLAKVFRTENPIDKFLDSPYGSLFAAQLAQGVITARGVENEKIKAVTVGGIAYAYNELGDLIPLEKTIDQVIGKLTEAADKVVK
ncbi:hypothetical protein PONTUS_208 [Vibrio phage Pontus]|uniref:Uncharacterized protein n=1 Tax=Vibrio phage Pontus TaxID=2590874 RepID=A0A4Y6EAK2_9CAUD|nr:hypothetical protein KNU59_gp010 [Vibrio phage Pontus]YP_010102805.1 hypothetical protein KNU59_gp095 [Vibrio phage Pontus]QDF14659.1 hypothetical protein PONTUS_10 [Vibrio phage Pontus]QDF14833.1 hypothetical protein PONTUS_208 [Vibrio phage Pontus]